jgi:hypothetical protein
VVWRLLSMSTTVRTEVIIARRWRTHTIPVASVTELIVPEQGKRPPIWLTRTDRSRIGLPGTSAADVEDLVRLTGLHARARTPFDP